MPGKIPKNQSWPHPENREKIAQKKKKWLKNRFSGHFSYFWAIFSLFLGEAKIDFSALSQARILAIL